MRYSTNKRKIFGKRNRYDYKNSRKLLSPDSEKIDKPMFHGDIKKSETNGE